MKQTEIVNKLISIRLDIYIYITLNIFNLLSINYSFCVRIYIF